MSNFSEIKLLHIDDHQLFVQGVSALIENETFLDSYISAGNLAESLEVCRIFKPDLVLLDYFLPDANGLKSIPEILKINPEIKILLLTMEDSLDIIEECRFAGAFGFLSKSLTKKDLVTAIKNASEGIKSFPQVVNQKPSGTNSSETTGSLSKREKEITILAAEGLTDSQIAEKLNLSELTVKTHHRILIQKLKSQTSAD
jgi:DNA-binding NarL/FixJ family response regulator